MKPNITKYISFLLVITLIVSCEEFVNVEPEDRIDAPSFFANDEEVILGLNGVYASQRSIYGNGSVYQLLEHRADNSAMDPLEQEERVSTDWFGEVEGNLNVLTSWTRMYTTINLANLVIDRAPDATGDATVISRAAGEAKFIRALTYFDLVVLWGGVPLRLAPTTDFDNSVVARSNADEVYSQIVQDLNDAISVLPDSYDGSSMSEVGRVTKYAALTLLGKVELQRGNASAAESALRQVLGKYSLLDNFADIHAAGNDNTAESIFEISYNPDNQTGFGMPNSFIPASEAARLGIVAGGTSGIMKNFPTWDISRVFDPADLRIDATFRFAEADSQLYISKFIDLSAAAQGYNINQVILRYADALLMLAEAIGEGAEAYGYINQVRTRAGLPDIDAATPGTFMEKLMNERRFEFAFEMHRWIDLLRLPDQEVIDIMQAHINDQMSGTPYDPPPILNSDDLLFPIPVTEIEVSDGVVTQNPGY